MSLHIIAGFLKNRSLFTPKSQQTRPTSSRLRGTFFNICQHCIEEADFLDLFAGSGAMGIEALSRGAKSSTFVDNHKEATHCIVKNVQNLNIKEKSVIIHGDVLEVVRRFSESRKQFDLIYADPPYGKMLQTLESYSLQLLKLLDTLPILKENGRFFIEDTFLISPENVNCQTIFLKSSRRAGNAFLYEFHKKRSL